MNQPDPATIPGRNCATGDPEQWFATEGAYTHPATARRLCHECPALDVCLEWALTFESRVSHSGRSGIYGGTTPRQRAMIAAKRRKDAA